MIFLKFRTNSFNFPQFHSFSLKSSRRRKLSMHVQRRRPKGAAERFCDGYWDVRGPQAPRAPESPVEDQRGAEGPANSNECHSVATQADDRIC